MILSVDSQLLNAIQACSRKAQFAHIENLQPQTKAVALEKGDLVHKLLEIYDGLGGNCVNEDSDTWLSLKESGLYGQLNGLYGLEHGEKVQFAIEAGKLFASKMELDTENAASVIYQFSEYCKFYQNDPWSTLAVEEVASRVLYDENEGYSDALIPGKEPLTIIYNGKIDRVVEQGNIRAPMDHKSSERRADPSSLSNQFIGYCWLLGMNNIIIDKIGFQKTLKPVERFQRYILTIDDQRIDEWKSNSIWWLKQWAESLQRQTFPMNLTSCDKYGSCIYSSICESNPEGRNWKKERDYLVGQQWDVARVLEGK